MNHFANIAARLKERGLDAMLITSAPGEFYAAGFHGEGAAVITPDQSWYWSDSRYIEAAGQQVTGAQVSMPAAGMNYRKLGQQVVAEGIESREQAELALRCGADRIQGFYYARPMPESELAAWYHSRKETGDHT